MIHQFLWVIYPYLALIVMITGLLWRFTYAQIGWGAPSTEILEKKMLRSGSMLFHYGIIFAFLGHVMGVLIPRGVYEFFGITEGMYHFNAIVFGGVAGLMTWIGLMILLIRKFKYRRLLRVAGIADFVSLFLLLIIVSIGTYLTVIYDTTIASYEYRDTIGPWFRGILTLHPNPLLMLDVPPIFQVHVLVSFLLFAVIPFTKLIHFWSLPLRYPARAPIQYRSRAKYGRK